MSARELALRLRSASRPLFIGESAFLLDPLPSPHPANPPRLGAGKFSGPAPKNLRLCPALARPLSSCDFPEAFFSNQAIVTRLGLVRSLKK